MKYIISKYWSLAIGKLPIAGLWVFLLAGVEMEAATIYVDNRLTNSCVGNYSITNRNASGTNGDAYPSVVQAANVAVAGDVVVIRGGIYHSASSTTQNDVLWPKHSGTSRQPITFTAYTKEKVILGNGPTNFPADSLSIACGTITLSNVNFITIRGLEVSQVAGWVYARNCQHILFQSCTFVDALNGAKATARFIESKYLRFLSCKFTNAYDNLALIKCDYSTVINCTFSTAAHTTLALRGCNFSVVRNCKFANPYYQNQAAEKLVEVYDVKLDVRDPANPAYTAIPAYNSTQHNLFESNFFGYHPARTNTPAQPSAMEYSGQYGIIRENVFSNPPLVKPDPKYPDAKAGGMGIFMRWGGSWSGWISGQGWIGDGIEAGYVTHNRVYNNVFYGYDNGCINTPNENAMNGLLNPPPLFNTNPSAQYAEPYAFADNVFQNNIISPGLFQSHFSWTWQALITGWPIGLTMLGVQPGVFFLNNDFYASALQAPALIYLLTTNSSGLKINLVGDVAQLETVNPDMFLLNLELNPQFANTNKSDFRLLAGSPLVGAGAPLTVAVGTVSSGTQMQVKDAAFFYDGFGISGELGDVIQLDGQTTTARVVHVDYDNLILTLDRAISWLDGQGVNLRYAGAGPNIGL